MANALYSKAKEGLLSAAINLPSANIKAVLVDSGAYTRDLSADQFLSDIPGGARIATSGNLTNKTVTDGVFDADDVTFVAVSGVQCEYVILYVDTGSAATSRLICCLDTITGFPVTPSGGDILIQFDNGAQRIFAL